MGVARGTSRAAVRRHGQQLVSDEHDRLIWAAFGMVVILVVVTGLLVFGSIFLAPGSDQTVKQMIEGRIIARAIVLFMIVPTIAILCVQDKISGEAALAALSSIAGYILGGAAATQPGSPSKKAPRTGGARGRRALRCGISEGRGHP